MHRAALLEILNELERAREEGLGVGARLVEVCVRVLKVTGAGIMLMNDGKHRGTLGLSDPTVGVVEELQFTLGEGPCVDAYHLARPISEPSLEHPVSARWPLFAGPAVRAGVAAIFAFPLQIGAIQLGALDVYLDHPADLSQDQFVDAQILATVITNAVLELLAAKPADTLAAELDRSDGIGATVHQASGMIAVQLGVPIAEALVRLRAYAFAQQLPVNDVARLVITRELRIESP